MLKRKLNSIEDVVQLQLCTGCGICASLEPDRFEMDEVVELGRRPFVKENAAEETKEALLACPGINLKHTVDPNTSSYIKSLSDGWGPVLEVWEGYASDEGTRYSGSSGGAATALASFSLQKEEFGGVLHTKARADIPYLNETTFSKTQSDLIAATGSRYSPASPCDRLDLVLQEEKLSTFIGKPCDVAALKNAFETRPELKEKIGVTIAFFCAGTPSIQGTLDLAKEKGIGDSSKIQNVRYRGNGWPGLWTIDYLDDGNVQKSVQLTYEESWGYLQKYRQWRCYICPDHTGEFADIAVGDPWYREVEANEIGKSLIIARTERGRQFIIEAEKAGAITLEKSDPALFPQSQPNLLSSRGNIWPRLLLLRLFGAAVPNYQGFCFFKFWWNELNFPEKRQSLIGTLKRIYIKKLTRRQYLTRNSHHGRGSNR